MRRWRCFLLYKLFHIRIVLLLMFVFMEKTLKYWFYDVEKSKIYMKNMFTKYFWHNLESTATVIQHRRSRYREGDFNVLRSFLSEGEQKLFIKHQTVSEWSRETLYND